MNVCSIAKQLTAKCRTVAILIALASAVIVNAQDVKVYGVVTDAETGEEIIGATVQTSNQSAAAITDIDGKYQITVKAGQELRFSYIGYATQSVTVRKAGELNITLRTDENMLDQVVVVGYGTMKRSDLTGSVASIDEKAIKQGVNTSVEQAMQGRIAGVAVTQNSGAPGGGISVQIRGINSLNGNEPLYVIDGIAMSGQTSDNTSVMASINPSDITSIEVLKDASATAIYGSRASNGVVLITTKRGQEGKAKLTYEGYMGWQQLPKTLEVMDLYHYADFYNVRAGIMGWGEQNVKSFIEEVLSKNPDISSRQLSREIVTQAYKFDKYKANDDITCVVVYVRKPRRTLIVTGAPRSRESDRKLGDIIRLMAVRHKRVDAHHAVWLVPVSYKPCKRIDFIFRI